VLRAMPVEVLLDGGTRERLHDRIVALARMHGTRVVSARAGLGLLIGTLRIRVLSPADPGRVTEDPNAQSIVALASYGSFDTLLTADAESDVTASLSLPRVELLKVAHHGSADPGLSALLERLSPQLAVIEVGAHNRYGHPSPATLTALERVVPTVRRTDRDGDVTVSEDGGGMTVATER
jgi:competence protein ComEC